MYVVIRPFFLVVIVFVHDGILMAKATMRKRQRDNFDFFFVLFCFDSFFSSNFSFLFFIIFSFRCGMTERPLHNANLVMAGLAMGCPGTPGGDETP